ncbi:MAG TPA: LPXTG cell wall anchor domain-containing protein [Actinomycetota bacterium]|nr:LPXTG cell wall anchor domain-containing protein [Actinomycetota bacterium]
MKKVVVALFVTGLVGLAGTVPASAQAYGGQPGLSCTNDTVTGDHLTPNTTPTIYVDGHPSGQAQVGRDGSFSFTLPASAGSGRHTVTVQGISARAVCSIPSEVAGETVQKGKPAPETTTPPGGTAFTGASVITPSLIAVGLLLLGVASIVAGRRRRRIRAGAGDGSGDGPAS